MSLSGPFLEVISVNSLKILAAFLASDFKLEGMGLFTRREKNNINGHYNSITLTREAETIFHFFQWFVRLDWTVTLYLSHILRCYYNFLQYLHNGRTQENIGFSWNEELRDNLFPITSTGPISSSGMDMFCNLSAR